MGLQLYTYPNNKNAFKALIAAEYVGAKIELPAFQMGVTNKSPEFLKLNPFGKVPTLKTPAGGVFESNAIARYVARLADKGLLGKTTYEEGLVEQWIDVSTNEVDKFVLDWLLPIMYYKPYSKEGEEAAIEGVKKGMKLLNDHLASRTFLVGDDVTLADIIAFCNSYWGYTRAFDAAFRAEFPHVTRWFQTLAHQPQFKKVTGDITLAAAAPKYTPKEGAEKPAAKAAAPKAEKPAAKPAAPAAAADDGEGGEEKPKGKNPLDLLPPSKMVLDSYKRLYSNTPPAQFREIAVKGLWEGADIPKSPTNEHFEGYDPEGFSVWLCEYKYPEENTVNYVTMNKVGGFLQRIDYVRKYAFGVMCILKNKEGQFPIRGFWIFRGDDIPWQMKDECYDLDLYTWEKADVKDPAVKARIEDMLAEEATIDGLEHVECKVFK